MADETTSPQPDPMAPFYPTFAKMFLRENYDLKRVIDSLWPAVEPLLENPWSEGCAGACVLCRAQPGSGHAPSCPVERRDELRRLIRGPRTSETPGPGAMTTAAFELMGGQRDVLRAILAPLLDEPFVPGPNGSDMGLDCLFCRVDEPSHEPNCPVLRRDELLGRT